VLVNIFVGRIDTRASLNLANRHDLPVILDLLPRCDYSLELVSSFECKLQTQCDLNRSSLAESSNSETTSRLKNLNATVDIRCDDQDLA